MSGTKETRSFAAGDRLSDGLVLFRHSGLPELIPEFRSTVPSVGTTDNFREVEFDPGCRYDDVTEVDLSKRVLQL